MISTLSFCRVVSDKKLKNSGLSRGDVVFVGGDRMVPASKKDPYLHRTVFYVFKVVDDVVQMPKQGNEHMAYLVDPRSLEEVSKEENDRLMDVLEGR